MFHPSPQQHQELIISVGRISGLSCDLPMIQIQDESKQEKNKIIITVTALRGVLEASSLLSSASGGTEISINNNHSSMISLESHNITLLMETLQGLNLYLPRKNFIGLWSDALHLDPTPSPSVSESIMEQLKLQQYLESQNQHQHQQHTSLTQLLSN
jgi:hypothetical protein